MTVNGETKDVIVIYLKSYPNTRTKKNQKNVYQCNLPQESM